MRTSRRPLPRKHKKPGSVLEAELSAALRQVESVRNRQLVARYLGWDGSAPCSLAEVGAQYQLTRERVRQVYGVALPLLRQYDATPVLDAVLSFIKGQEHELVCDVERSLQQQGLTDGISLQAVLRAARVFRRKPGFQLQHVGSSLFVGPVSQIAQTVLNTAMKAIVRNGAARMPDLCQEISRSAGRRVDERLVRRILQTRADIGWLDEAREWFWLSSVPRNRLVARIRKVLAVHPRVCFSRLHSAISRDYIPLNLPEPILRSICAQLSWCRVSSQHVEARVIQPIDDVLAGGEAIIYGVLRSHGGVLSLPQLQTSCRGRVKKENLWRVLSFSPLIERLRKETYGLIEAEAAP